MADIIFARPRHDYQSYTDLWALVKLSGFPLIYIDEIDPTRKDKTYIFSSPDASLSWVVSHARIINWMLEWYEDYEQRAGVAETWHPDATFAQQIGARFVPIGSDPRLGDMPFQSRRYDLIHLQYINGRRGRIIGELSDRGLSIADNAWGDDRDRNLRSSRLMLHVHQHDSVPALAPLRVALAAAYHLPLVSERAWECPHIPPGIVTQFDYEDLVAGVAGLNGDLSSKGEALHYRLCYDYQFEKVVRAAV